MATPHSSTQRFTPRTGWGPDARRCALSITFDNFGEAADIELGLWGGKPIGQNPTVAWLPTLIEALGDVPATYFIEGINATVYPEQVKRWQRCGHEVALHAWRHEFWARCDAARRRALLQQSLDAMHAIGVRPVGFRPPGGAIPAEAWAEFEEAGLLYCSDASDAGVHRVGNIISVPFMWRAVDVYMIEEVAAPLRLQNADQSAAFSLSDWAAELDRTITTLVRDGGQRTLIFHPQFLSTSEEKFRVFTDLIDRVRDDHDIWLARACDVADFAARALQLPVPEPT